MLKLVDARYDTVQHRMVKQYGDSQTVIQSKERQLTPNIALNCQEVP